MCVLNSGSHDFFFVVADALLWQNQVQQLARYSQMNQSMNCGLDPEEQL